MPSMSVAQRKQAFENLSKGTFTVVSFNASLIDQDPKVYETLHLNKVRYESTFFYADAKVKCVIPGSANYEVGFIQHCTAINQTHSYQSGNYTQWEFPTPISDTDGNFPWYQVDQPSQAIPNIAQTGKGMVTIAGPKGFHPEFFVNLSMNDNLMSNVQWWDPVQHETFVDLAATPHELRSIARNQTFKTWLVARPAGSSTNFSILRVVTWTIAFSITFDCSQPKGSRCQSITRQNTIASRAGLAGEIIPLLTTGTKTANEMMKLWAYDGQTGQRLGEINQASW